MARQKKAVVDERKEDNTKQLALEQENILLKKKLADQERLNIEKDKAFGGVALEMKKIRAKGKSSAHSITVYEKHDHKNISLWTKDGKRVGPMHPDNAIQALNRFADLGILLSADQPTPEQIEAYKETTEWEGLEKKRIARRTKKDKSRRSGVMERLTAEIAKMSGTTTSAINSILKAKDVGK